MLLSLTLVVILLLTLGFAIGLIVPALHRTGGSLFSLLKSKSGYMLSFIAGALVAGFLATILSPYRVASWAKVYPEYVLGAEVAKDQAALKTGQIPQYALDWYHENKGD